jgi:hypothetical protein
MAITYHGYRGHHMDLIRRPPHGVDTEATTWSGYGGHHMEWIQRPPHGVGTEATTWSGYGGLHRPWTQRPPHGVGTEATTWSGCRGHFMEYAITKDLKNVAFGTYWHGTKSRKVERTSCKSTGFASNALH